MRKQEFISGKVTLFAGDCLDVLAELPENSIDACVTDPPYHLASIVKRFGADDAAPAISSGATGVYKRASSGFMGKQWDGGDIAFRPETWAAVLRVLKPGAHLVAFGAPKNAHRVTCAIEDAGFEIRDGLMWIFGAGFPKSHSVGKALDRLAGADRERMGARPRIGINKTRVEQGYRPNEVAQSYDSGPPVTDAAREWEGWGTALKPAFEPIVLTRKPLSEGTVAANVLRWRTGALNIGACRVAVDPIADASQLRTMSRGQRVEDTSGQTWGLSKSGGDVPQVVRAEGRWPANVVLSWPEDEYELRRDITPAQRAELYGWLSANA